MWPRCGVESRWPTGNASRGEVMTILPDNATKSPQCGNSGIVTKDCNQNVPRFACASGDLT
jgi:hypothetical protein